MFAIDFQSNQYFSILPAYFLEITSSSKFHLLLLLIKPKMKYTLKTFRSHCKGVQFIGRFGVLNNCFHPPVQREGHKFASFLNLFGVEDVSDVH